VLAGWCYDTTGGYDLVFRFFAAANGVVLAALFLLRRERAEGV
jgi:hypothetical protein